MEVVPYGDNYLKVYPQPTTSFNPDMFLGWRHQKGSSYYIVENNIVNRLVLNQPCSGIIAKDTYNIDETSLLEYQKVDVSDMCLTRHILNANPMGLGKTIETIKYLEAINAKSVLIVVPKIIRTQWVAQIKEWLGRDAYIYEDQKIISPNNIWIINYDKLRSEIVLTKFRSFAWDVLILDEAHKIKNRKSKQTLAVKCIPAIRRVALTGTPILRYVDDLWSILHFLDWRYSGISYYNFVNYFCSSQRTPWGNKICGLTEDPEKVNILTKLLTLVSIRHNALEVAKGKTQEVVKVEMQKEQKELYTKAKKLLLDELPENCTIANGAVLTTRLRQITSWPGLFLENVTAGGKFEWILETCQNHPDENFVVFSAFEKSITALQQYLKDNKISCATITGKNDPATNLQNKQMFLQDECQVLAGTIGAMGQGYDGLQKVCRLMVFLDREWSPEIMAQAEDRLHRMGQESPVHIYYLECKNTFDQYVGRINQNKSDDIREALKNDIDT